MHFSNVLQCVGSHLKLVLSSIINLLHALGSSMPKLSRTAGELRGFEGCTRNSVPPWLQPVCLELPANNYIIRPLNPELLAFQVRRAEPLKHFVD